MFHQEGSSDIFLHQEEGAAESDPSAVEFSEHLEEGQNGISEEVAALIQDLEEVSQQPLIVPSQPENEDNFRLSDEVKKELEKLLTPETSNPDEGSESENCPPNEVLPSTQQQQQVMLNTLVDELWKKNRPKAKGRVTLKNHQDGLDGDEENTGKVKETQVERVLPGGGAEKLGIGEAGPGDSPQRVTKGNVDLFFKVELHGQESKNYKVQSRSQKEFSKVMEGVAKHLGIEASSLRFFLEKEGLLRRLTGKERAIDLAGASMVVKENK